MKLALMTALSIAPFLDASHRLASGSLFRCDWREAFVGAEAMAYQELIRQEISDSTPYRRPGSLRSPPSESLPSLL